jgi:flagellar FliL protein
MADTGTSKDKSRKEHEDDIRSMRAGGQASEEKPKKSKKKLIVMLLLVLLLAGGGGAGYKFFLAKPDSDMAEAAEPEPPKEEPVELIYIELDPLFVPFETAEGENHKIVLILSLEVNRANSTDKRVRSLLPRLRESYVRSLTSRPFPGTEDGTIETVYLKNRIRAENNRILGIGAVSDVLVRDIRIVSG